jgi:hypothetical protein
MDRKTITAQQEQASLIIKVATKRVRSKKSPEQPYQQAEQPKVEVLAAAEPKAKRATSKRKPKSLKDKIEMALKHEEQQMETEATCKNSVSIRHSRHSRHSHRQLLFKGAEVFDLPWTAQTAAPWSNGYRRILIPRKHPTNCGHYAITQIVRNDKLSYGNAN